MKCFSISSSQFRLSITTDLNARLEELQHGLSKLTVSKWSVICHINEKDSFLVMVFIFSRHESLPLPIIVPFTGSKVLNFTSEHVIHSLGISNQLYLELVDFAHSIVDRLESDGIIEQIVTSVKVDALWETASQSEEFMDSLRKWAAVASSICT